MKKIVVNENCIGCGACSVVDEEHFEMDGTSKVINNDNLDSPNLQNAIDSCPVAAISIEDDEQ